MDFGQSFWYSSGSSGDQPWEPGADVRGSIRFIEGGGYSFTRAKTATTRTTFTLSIWVRRVTFLDREAPLISNGTTDLRWMTDSTLRFQDGSITRRSSHAYEDITGWYHIVISGNSDAADPAARLRMWVNGVECAYQQEDAVAQGHQFAWTDACTVSYGSSDFGGFFTELVFTEGAHTPTNFGEFDALGQWRPIAFDVTYGAQGWRYVPINFGQLGTDYSGNNNNATASGFSNDTGTNAQRYGWSRESPTAVHALFDQQVDAYNNDGIIREAGSRGIWTDNGGGGQYWAQTVMDGMPLGCNTYVEGWCSSVNNRNSGITLHRNGNNGYNASSIYWQQAHGDAGESYIRTTEGNALNNCDWGTRPANQYDETVCTGGWYYTSWSSSKPTAFMVFGGPDAEGRAFQVRDGDNKVFCIASYLDGTSVWDWEFQGAYRYSISTGGYSGPKYLYLNTGHYPWRKFDASWGPSLVSAGSHNDLRDRRIQRGRDFSDVRLAAGADIHAAITRAIPNGLRLIKDRENSERWHWVDSVNGNDQELVMGEDHGLQAYQAPAGNSVGVGWVLDDNRVNGFDIVTWSGNDAASRDIAHNLGQRPELIIIKSTNTTQQWVMWHKNATGDGTFVLSDPSNQSYQSGNIAGGVFLNPSGQTNGMTPDSFRIGGTNGLGNVNATGSDYVAYLWCSVEGYSKIGITGGITMRTTGGGISAYGSNLGLMFKPRFIMLKGYHTGNGGNWWFVDTERTPHNLPDGAMSVLNMLTADIENNTPFGWWQSNRFMPRSSDPFAGGSWAYMAFADVPTYGNNVSNAPAY